MVVVLSQEPMSITAVLNGYRRTKNLDDQIDALLGQTVPPDEVLIWHNAPQSPDIEQNLEVQTRSKSAYSNFNFGVWARFAYALNARSEYVCVFDDDTIPGSAWFENCLATMAQTEALLGTIGVLYANPPPPESPEVSYYNPMSKIGWYRSGNFDESIEVDFVGHAWFFKRDWLSTFWRELPDPDTTLCGEDMHFSFMLQKYLGIPTIVPPHPVDKIRLWGSIRGEIGQDENSLWESNPKDADGTPFRSAMDRFFVGQRRKGWRLVHDPR